MKNHQPSAEGLEAIRAVIDARGFETLAMEFMTRPEYRDRIVQMITAEMDRCGWHSQAKRFNALAQHILHGTQIFA